MQPVRKVISATHFKPATLPSGKTGWTPCSPGDPKAVEKSWSEVESDELVEPPLRIQDFVKSLESTRPTVTEADIKRHDDWTKESGEHNILVYRFMLSELIYMNQGTMVHEYVDDLLGLNLYLGICFFTRYLRNTIT